uniref:Uncharacterized protein n=1 Tax=Rhizophora mucronata TaxID=61149 RepID=A0A2P2PDN9_RHIMU
MVPDSLTLRCYYLKLLTIRQTNKCLLPELD